MKPSELRDLPNEEIEVQIANNRAQLFKFRFHAKNEEMQRAGEIRHLRRQIARLKTILRERELRGKESAGARS